MCQEEKIWKQDNQYCGEEKKPRIEKMSRWKTDVVVKKRGQYVKKSQGKKKVSMGGKKIYVLQGSCPSMLYVILAI